ncbi:MAG: hypothetical protein JSV20_00975 [Candidatus Bathyarchaeota archaeon]|nr:MAG: hypothetical protein JSV20_00975 [Candidatus Bathyarchaeota archaeon]
MHKTFLHRKNKSKKKRRHAEIQICPKCLNPKIRRMSASSGDMTGALAILPPKYVCHKCGWVGRLVIMRDVEISNNEVDKMNGKR